MSIVTQCHRGTFSIIRNNYSVIRSIVIGFGTVAMLPLLMGCSEPSEAAQDETETQRTLRDVAEQSKQAVNRQWLIGMVEGAYLFNPNLNNFAIDVDAKGSTIIIEGAVDEKSQGELAEQIALSIDGVDKVDNRIRVEERTAQSEQETEQSAKGLQDNISDAAITTRVKTRLLANSFTRGFAINVDTDDARVTLQGEVESDTERDLAYYIAKNTEGVNSVENQLKVTEKEQISRAP